MTPAERARQIDKEVFAAESAAIRKRAFEYVRQRRLEDRARASTWLGRAEPAAKFNPVFTSKPKQEVERKPHASAHLFTHDGKTLTLKEWAAITGISSLSLRSRIANGWTIHDTLTVPIKAMGKRMHRGVVSNLPASLGTGGVSTLQESTNITFSRED